MLEGLRGRHEFTSVKTPERAMPVVTTRVTSQNGGLATVVVGIAARPPLASPLMSYSSPRRRLPSGPLSPSVLFSGEPCQGPNSELL